MIDRCDGYDLEMTFSYQWVFFSFGSYHRSCAPKAAYVDLLTADKLLTGLYRVCVAEARAQPQP